MSNLPGSYDRLSLEAAAQLVDLGCVDGAEGIDADTALRQLKGAVAVYNRLSDARVVWLSDEVGMGKTFVALAVAALFRMANPAARILYLLPTSRLFVKWQTEHRRFFAGALPRIDHRAVTFGGQPVRELSRMPRLYDVATGLLQDPWCDVMTTTGAFSFGLMSASEDDITAGRTPKTWLRAWRKLRGLVEDGSLPKDWRALRDPEDAARDSMDKLAFKRAYANAMHRLLPDFDLVICDEAHNLKRGIHHGAARNQMLARALGGHPHGESRVRRLLCLTATPVEHSYTELTGQAEVFGISRSHPMGEPQDDPLVCLQGDRADDVHRAAAKRLIVRRITGLRLDGVQVPLTKNLYRRQWRRGGVKRPDGALTVQSDASRLMVALMQRRVMHALRQRAGQSAGRLGYTAGMLSSFESWGESVENRLDRGSDEPESPEYEEHDVRLATAANVGVDRDMVAAIARSYRERFGVAPPHPKMNQVAQAVALWALAGEKTLVFVRRVRTTEELAARIQETIDGDLYQTLCDCVEQDAERAVHRPWRAYLEYRKKMSAAALAAVDEAAPRQNATRLVPSFFAWMFHGAGHVDRRPGGYLKSNRLSDGPLSFYDQDNYALALMADDEGALRALLGGHQEELAVLATQYARDVSGPLKPRHRYEAWQAAALRLIAREHPEEAVRNCANALLGWRYPIVRARPASRQELQNPEDWLFVRPLFAQLRQARFAWMGSALKRHTPPMEPGKWLDYDRRRALLAGWLNLGLGNVPLYAAMVALDNAQDASAGRLASEVLTRLEVYSQHHKAGAWSELLEVARHGDAILAANVPSTGRDAPANASLFARKISNLLTEMTPVLAIHGASKSQRAMRQFRMPGYPRVLVATDVLREGVDLHTFCARVVHYGITHSATGTEQRIGRVDRIGSLVRRRLRRPDDEDDKIQVLFPHLADTLEPLQMQKLYGRMDVLERLVHEDFVHREESSPFIDLEAAVDGNITYKQPAQVPLKSAFNEAQSDLQGASALVDTAEDDGWVYRLVKVAIDGLHAVLKSPEPLVVHAPEDGGRDATWAVEIPSLPAAGENEGAPRRQPFVVVVTASPQTGRFCARVRSPIGWRAFDDDALKHASRHVLTMPGLSLECVEPWRARGRHEAWFQIEAEVDLRPQLPVNRLTLAISAAVRCADDLERTWFPGRQDLALSQWHKGRGA